MAAAPDDWRRAGQEKYLRGARLTWRRYQARSGNWEHEHCAFCWQKFLDANYSAIALGALAEQPGTNDAEGYTTVGDDHGPAGSRWICKPCFGDFAEEFGWTVEDGDSEAWPYDSPDPNPRPTERDYIPRT